jgi:4-amino-4-deoxy-L-arabinose transferase-like glycosyltransferase
VTDLLGCFVAFLVVGLANVLIIAAVRSGPHSAEGSFLARVYLTTLGLRCGMALLLNTTAADSALAAMFWGDSGTYDVAGDLLARRWHGEPAAVTALTEALSGYGFVYYVASIYFFFGRNQLLVQFLNATTGSLTVLVIYAITRRLFGPEPARWSALFMAFFPQMLFWSAGMYKDPTVLLCIALSMYAVLRLRERFSLGMGVVLGLAAVALLSLRFYIFYFVALAALGTFAFGRRVPLASRLASYLLVLAVFAGVFTFALQRETRDIQRSFMTLDQMQVTRQDQAVWGQSAYGTAYDVSTPLGALRALPVGLVYLLFAPFPWAITGVRQLLTLPETLVWYALMPAFVRGLVHSIRHRLRDVLPILVFMVTLTVAYALTQGNVGTAYRQRTQVTMFFFVLMGLGLVERRRSRGGMGYEPE